MTFTRHVWRKYECEFIYNGTIHERGLWKVSMNVKLRKLEAAECLLAKQGDLRGVTINSLPVDSAMLSSWVWLKQ